MATTQPQSHLPTQITKPGLSYGKNVIASIKYHLKPIRSKGFDDGLSVPTEKGLNKKLGYIAMATTQPQSHLPTPIPMVKM
jgi:hypothetical protein